MCSSALFRSVRNSLILHAHPKTPFPLPTHLPPTPNKFLILLERLMGTNILSHLFLKIIFGRWVGLARASYYREAEYVESRENLELIRLIDEEYTRHPSPRATCAQRAI